MKEGRDERVGRWCERETKSDMKYEDKAREEEREMRIHTAREKNRKGE